MGTKSKAELNEMILTLKNMYPNVKNIERYKRGIFFQKKKNVIYYFANLKLVRDNIPLILDLNVFNEVVKNDLCIAILLWKNTSWLIQFKTSINDGKQQVINPLTIILDNNAINNDLIFKLKSNEYSMYFKNKNRLDYRKENLEGILPKTFLSNRISPAENILYGTYSFHINVLGKFVGFYGRTKKECIDKVLEYKKLNFDSYLLKFN
jgi:hypothetical protein